MNRKIYQLQYSDEAWGHIDFTKNQAGAVRVPIDYNSTLDVDMVGIRNVELPNQLFFASDYKIIPAIDFPKNDIGLTIFSNKMLTIFTNLGDFKFRSLPTIMLDHKEMEAYHIEEGELLEDLKKRNDDYVGIQLMEYTSAFDKENSEYKVSRAIPDMIRIRELVLKEPEKGFPPIFKIEEDTTMLFITEQAKNALEAANIKGCVFEEVEVSQ